METLARNHYALSDERNPVNCTLFYLSLKKKNILAGLWKTAVGNKEQPAMLKFLAHDFREDRWRTAAIKNAYALLAKQRYGTTPSVKSSNCRVCGGVLFISGPFKRCCQCVYTEFK